MQGHTLLTLLKSVANHPKVCLSTFNISLGKKSISELLKSNRVEDTSSNTALCALKNFAVFNIKLIFDLIIPMIKY